MNQIFRCCSGIFLISLLLSACVSDGHQYPDEARVNGTEYFVAKNGSDAASGSSQAPFLTINHAAQIAGPGDTVTVRQGVYREWVRPKHSGLSEQQRITYRAAPGEDVRILGSELYRGWQAEGHVWKLLIANKKFGDFNPFATLTRHPIPVEEDEEGDGWGWLKYGRWTHLGDLIIDGQGLTEKQTIAEVTAAPMSWHVEVSDSTTLITANFDGRDPNLYGVELNHRPYAFFPKTPGLNFITVRGFTIMNVANHWAPPVHYQPGALGPNGGHHWIIEDNIVLYAKAACIAIGNPTGVADEKASGYHIIRNNVLMRCGQAGTAGAGWNKHSEISGNYIEDINYREEFGGWETAGIKHHVTSHLTIRNNFIRDVFTVDAEIGSAHGIWMDYENTQWRITGNIIQNVESEAILTEANWTGPNLIDNNILIGGRFASYSSRGDVWLHNTFIDTEYRSQDQDWGDRPKVGNARWQNNLFIGKGFVEDFTSDNTVYQHNAYLNDARPHEEDLTAISMEGVEAEVQTHNSDSGFGLILELPGFAHADLTVPLIGHNALQTGFEFSSAMDTDLMGIPRKADTNAPGALAKLRSGRQIIPLWKISNRVRQAKAIIGESPDR